MTFGVGVWFREYSYIHSNTCITNVTNLTIQFCTGFAYPVNINFPLIVMKSGPVAQAKSSVLLEVIILSLAHDLHKKEG